MYLYINAGVCYLSLSVDIFSTFSFEKLGTFYALNIVLVKSAIHKAIFIFSQEDISAST